jgi:hypothetical protein
MKMMIENFGKGKRFRGFATKAKTGPIWITSSLLSAAEEGETINRNIVASGAAPLTYNIISHSFK